MPMDPATLESLIKEQLTAIPMGSAPDGVSISSSPNADGSSTVSTIPNPPKVLFMDSGMANVIAKAISISVVSFLSANAVATGANGGGPVISKIT